MCFNDTIEEATLLCTPKLEHIVWFFFWYAIHLMIYFIVCTPYSKVFTANNFTYISCIIFRTVYFINSNMHITEVTAPLMYYFCR